MPPANGFHFLCAADAIRNQLSVHMDDIMTDSMPRYYSLGSRVLVGGLQNQPQYKRIKGIVVKMDFTRMRVTLDSSKRARDALHMCVCLNTHDSKEFVLMPEKMCPLFSTIPKL